MTGRGAWTVVGHGNGSRWYEFIPGQPLDGGTPELSADYLAVNYAVKALQTRFNALGLGPLTVDGVFGSRTSAAAKAAQTAFRVTTDGKVGPTTAKMMWLPPIVGLQSTYAIPGDYLCGLVRHESAFDPGAVGYSTPSDHGLVQINADANPSVTVAQAFDPGYALLYAAKRLAAAFAKYGRWDVAIASYNSPRAAQEWAATGTAPNPTIAKYVSTIMGGCP